MERIEKIVVVNNRHGLHARPAAMFVQIANKFNSSVKVEKDGEAVDGKSIIAVLSLGVAQGTRLHLILEGDDSLLALAELKKVLESNND